MCTTQNVLMILNVCNTEPFHGMEALDVPKQKYTNSHQTSRMQGKHIQPTRISRISGRKLHTYSI